MKYAEGSVDKPPKYVDTFAAKTDIDPPSNKNLFSAAVTLAIVQFVLERLFRATMNPFGYILQCKIMSEEVCDDNQLQWVIICQLLGLLAAGVYVYMYLPPPKVMAKIFSDTKGKSHHA